MKSAIKKLASVVLDYHYMIKGSLRGIIYHTPPAHYLEHIAPGKVPIILIPGIFGKWTFLKELGDVLSLEGHPVYIIPDLKYNLFSIPHSASIVDSLVKSVRVSTPSFEKAIIVAHSKGGLIGKYFLNHYNKEGSVIQMISIATPYSGSSMAKFLPLDPIKELDTDSLIIQDLTKHVGINKKITSIIPEYDNHVWAEKGSYLEGAHNVHVTVHGHHRIVFDEGVRAVIIGRIGDITQQYATV